MAAPAAERRLELRCDGRISTHDISICGQEYTRDQSLTADASNARAFYIGDSKQEYGRLPERWIEFNRPHSLWLCGLCSLSKNLRLLQGQGSFGKELPAVG